MRDNRVTNLVLVPQALQLFMNAIEWEVRNQGKEGQWRFLMRLAPFLPVRVRRRLFRSVHRRLGGRLSYMMSGGAYLDPELERKWAGLGIPVLQAYGTTETSPVITTNTFRRRRAGSVGQALPGQEVRIAADSEVQTRGPNVTKGYWQNPEATNAAFDDGWYQTGDLGYLDRDGYLFLKGRKKDLIVLANGQNVYPEDIETVVSNQPGVRDSVVVGLDTGGGSVTVHAVLLLEDGSSGADVVRSANQTLASHQQIQGFSSWPDDDFPRTHTLKVRKPLVMEFLLNREKGAPASLPDAPDDQRSAISDLQRVLSSVCSLPAETLTPDKSLGLDLNLDSLGRVELLSAIEEELGAYVDEEQLSPSTTLQELEALIAAGGTEQDLPFPAWARTRWCGALRVVLQSGVIFPLLHIFYRVRVTGREHLAGLNGPLLFASNHNVKIDNPLIMMALPTGWRRRLCPAAAADFMLSNPLWRIAGPLLGNAFPFSREGAIRPSLEHLGHLLDWGWSVLIYPEGRSNRDGMESFKTGTGLVAVESRTPVVPIRVVLQKGGVFDRAGLLSRGQVEVRFGQPLMFDRRTGYREATEKLEAAVRAL
jgi:long-chain acyl-CoA synthetase